MKPVQLLANQPPRFYRGGAAIAALRGSEPKKFGPEDWVASCTTIHGEQTAGLTRLPDGTLLRDAIAEDPASWLGDKHVAAFGAHPALLVKLLDAGQRLPVHCHPSDEFAARHYHSSYGKTEAWIVVATEENPKVYLGFTEDVAEDTVAGWVARQDTAAMLAALNEVTVRPGDTVFVPAGVPHAIGAGVFLVELQQPTDLSVLLEWHGFADDEAAGHLGIGFETALGCVDRRGWANRIDELVRHDQAATELFGHPEFFRAERLTGGAELDASFGVLVVLTGTGVLHTEKVDVPLTQGTTLAVPHAAGESTVDGEVTAIRCLPPVSSTP